MPSYEPCWMAAVDQDGKPIAYGKLDVIISNDVTASSKIEPVKLTIITDQEGRFFVNNIYNGRAISANSESTGTGEAIVDRHNELKIKTTQSFWEAQKKDHEIQKNFIDHNWKSKAIMQLFLLQEGISNEEIKKNYQESFENITEDKIEESKKDCITLQESTSNAKARSSGPGLEKYQIRWIQLRNFAINYIANITTSSEIANLFCNLGLFRGAIERTQFGDIMKDSDLLENAPNRDGFGVVLINNDSLGPAHSYEALPSPEASKYRYDLWPGVFEKMNPFFLSLINNHQKAGEYKIEACGTQVISNVDISGETKLFATLTEMIGKMQAKITGIRVSVDNLGAFFVTFLEQYTNSCIIRKYYLDDPKSGNHSDTLTVAPTLNLPHSTETATSTPNESRTASETSSASPSAARPKSGTGTADTLRYFGIGRTSKFSTYDTHTPENHFEKLAENIFLDDGAAIEPGKMYVKFNTKKNGFLYSFDDRNMERIVTDIPLDGYQGSLPSALNPETVKIISGDILKAVPKLFLDIMLREYQYSTIYTEHPGLFQGDWELLKNRLSNLLSFPKGAEHNQDFLQALGEFCYLYINITPYKRGSAAIGEWLMYGLAKSRGIILGNFNQDNLSWDFSAFCAICPIEYGKNFYQFFKTVDLAHSTQLSYQVAAAHVKKIGLFEKSAASAAQAVEPNSSSQEQKKPL